MIKEAWNDANGLKNSTKKVVIPSLETENALPGIGRGIRSRPRNPRLVNPSPITPKSIPPKTLTNVNVECPNSAISTSLITQETIPLFEKKQVVGPLTVTWTMSATTIELSDTQKNQLASIGLADKFTNADSTIDKNILEFRSFSQFG